MASKDFNQNTGIFTGECLSSAGPGLPCAGFKTVYHPLAEREVIFYGISVSVHPYICQMGLWVRLFSQK